MKIKTKYYGEIEIDPKTIIEMKQPLYGLEQYTQFTILRDESIGDKLVWLQSVEESEICFLVTQPHHFVRDYQFELSYEALADVSAMKKEDVEVFSIVVPGSEFKDSTMNLKSPIVINPYTNHAMQVILEENYPFKHRMFQTC